jgi:hypothetical protein
MTVVKTELKLRYEAKYESAMTSLTSKLSYGDRRTILRGEETGQWVSVLPSFVFKLCVTASFLSNVEHFDYLYYTFAGL